MLRTIVGLLCVVIIMISIPILLTWSQSRRRLRVEPVDGVVVLRMPRGHWALLSTIAILPFGALSITAFVVTWAPGSESNGWILGGVMGLAGALFGGYLLLLEARGRIRIDETAIRKFGAVGVRTLPWAEVLKVTFNPVNNWFFLTGPGGKTIYFGEGLDGIASFADLALRRLPPKVLEANPEAEEALQEVSSFR